MKLVRVNKRFLIIACCGLLSFFCSQELFGISLDLPRQTLIDSIPHDDASIERRQFHNIHEKYNGTDFEYERNVENLGWWTRFKQWLYETIKDLFRFDTMDEASRVTDVALKIGGALIFLFVIYFIFKAIMNEEGSWVFGKSSDKNIIPVADAENNLQTTDFKQLIAQAEKNDDYRLAIRYYYLWLLKALADAGIIEYDAEKTNSDYYREIVQKDLKDGFSYTSYLYNYIWYGEFQVDRPQFEKAKSAFEHYLKSFCA